MRTDHDLGNDVETSKTGKIWNLNMDKMAARGTKLVLVFTPYLKFVLSMELIAAINSRNYDLLFP